VSPPRYPFVYDTDGRSDSLLSTLGRLFTLATKSMVPYYSHFAVCRQTNERICQFAYNSVSSSIHTSYAARTMDYGSSNQSMTCGTPTTRLSSKSTPPATLHNVEHAHVFHDTTCLWLSSIPLFPIFFLYFLRAHLIRNSRLKYGSTTTLL